MNSSSSVPVVVDTSCALLERVSNLEVMVASCSSEFSTKHDRSEPYEFPPAPPPGLEVFVTSQKQFQTCDGAGARTDYDTADSVDWGPFQSVQHRMNGILRTPRMATLPAPASQIGPLTVLGQL